MTVGCKNTIEFTLPQPFLCTKNISRGPFSVLSFKVLRVRCRVYVSDVAIGARKPCLLFQSPHSTTHKVVSAIICLCLRQINLSGAFSAVPNVKQTLDPVHVSARVHEKKQNNDGERIFLTILFLPAKTFLTFFFNKESELQSFRHLLDVSINANCSNV